MNIRYVQGKWNDMIRTIPEKCFRSQQNQEQTLQFDSSQFLIMSVNTSTQVCVLR